MNREVIAVGLAVCALATGGCSGIGGNGGKHAAQYFHDLGILGHQNEVTVQSGSDIRFLKVAGDGNAVFIEDRVTLGKVEIWGENCTVSIPEHLIIRADVVGVGSKVVRRPAGARPPAPGPEGEMIERIPIETGPEPEVRRQAQPMNVPATPPGGASSPPSTSPPDGATGSSGTTVTPAGERVIPPAGVHPAGGP